MWEGEEAPSLGTKPKRGGRDPHPPESVKSFWGEPPQEKKKVLDVVHRLGKKKQNFALKEKKECQCL